jgi:hypothetical protein
VAAPLCAADDSEVIGRQVLKKERTHFETYRKAEIFLK